ncbi:MAG: hypothetical protein ACLFT6_06895 [Bacteroidales bacterium]
MKIYKEYNKFERKNELQSKLQRLEVEYEREIDPETRLFIQAQIKNLKRQIRTIC